MAAPKIHQRISATGNLMQRIIKAQGIDFLHKDSRINTVAEPEHALLWILFLCAVDNDTAWRMIEELHQIYANHRFNIDGDF